MDSRYKTLTEGAILVDVKTDEPGEVSGETYNYYGMERVNGTWIIIRETTDEEEIRFAIGNGRSGGTYAEYFTNRQDLDYHLPSEYNIKN